jgi:hypothetical protein
VERPLLSLVTFYEDTLLPFFLGPRNTVRSDLIIEAHKEEGKLLDKAAENC